MIRLELLFFMQCLQGILMVVFLHKISRMKKQVDEITKEVKSYLSFIEDDIVQEKIQEENLKKNSKEDKLDIKTEKNGKISKDEAENRLIQAVLQEYFP